MHTETSLQRFCHFLGMLLANLALFFLVGGLWVEWACLVTISLWLADVMLLEEPVLPTRLVGVVLGGGGGGGIIFKI